MAEGEARTTEHLELEQMGTTQKVTMEVHGEPEARAALFAKIVKVQKTMKVLKHTGRYKQGNTDYTYATERDVLEPISEEFAKAGVAIIPGVVDSWWHDIPSKYNVARVTTVQIQAVLGDSVTGAYIITGSRSTAANADKATNAAFTTAFKYLLAKLAIVAFGDDADEYSIDGEKAGKQTAKAKPLTKAERDKLTTRIKEAEAGDAVKVLMKDKKITFSKVTDIEAKMIEELLT